MPMILTNDQIIELLTIEYEYWRNVKDPQIESFSMGAMGAVSNVIGAVAVGMTPEQYRAGKHRAGKLGIQNTKEPKQ